MDDQGSEKLPKDEPRDGQLTPTKPGDITPTVRMLLGFSFLGSNKSVSIAKMGVNPKVLT